MLIIRRAAAAVAPTAPNAPCSSYPALLRPAACLLRGLELYLLQLLLGLRLLQHQLQLQLF